MNKIRLVRIIQIAALTILAAMIVTAPAAQAKPKKKAKPDPVIQAINRAATTKTITNKEAKELRSVWLASGSAARRAPGLQRRREVQAVRTYTTNLAKRKQLTPARVRPVLLSVKATTYVMRNGKVKFPRHEAVVKIPGEVVLFKYYSGRGVQFQPFETFKLGMQYVNVPVPDLKSVRKLADRMLELGVPVRSATTWEYYFPFGGPSKPWISSLSQSLGTEFYYRTSKLYEYSQQSPGADEYLADGEPAATDAELAKAKETYTRALRTFQMSSRIGGVSVPEGGGSWYLIYPFVPSQRILNGHLQVLVNMQRIAEETQLAVAKRIVANGVKAVVPLLPRFDTGGWSRYQFGQEANLNYHEFQTSQLKKIKAYKEIPERDTFIDWHDKFATYLVTPPNVTTSVTSLPSILGASDGFRDTVKITYATDKRSTDRVRILNSENKWVREYWNTHGAGTTSITWDGLDKDRKMVPEGEYFVQIRATDIKSNRVVTTLEPIVKVIADNDPPIITSYSVKPAGKGKTAVVVRGRDVRSGWVEASIEQGRTVLSTQRGKRNFQITMTVNRPIGVVRKAQLKLRDSSGNTVIQPLGEPAS